MSAGRPPPVTGRPSIGFNGLPSSFPIQIPTTKLSVYPINHASRDPWLVPVLPAAEPPKSALRPVPCLITDRSKSSIVAAF